MAPLPPARDSSPVPLAAPLGRRYGLGPFRCIGGPLNGEVHESSVHHVLWCVAERHRQGRPTVVLVHVDVLALPVVLESIADARETLGGYVVDPGRQVLRWRPRSELRASIAG
jgi:hypothetical protein